MVVVIDAELTVALVDSVDVVAVERIGWKDGTAVEGRDVGATDGKRVAGGAIGRVDGDPVGGDVAGAVDWATDGALDGIRDGVVVTGAHGM